MHGWGNTWNAMDSKARHPLWYRRPFFLFLRSCPYSLRAWSIIAERVMAGEVKSNEDIPPCLSVIMPVYNEEGTVSTMVESVLQQRPVKELIVVDDCSHDKTWEQLQKSASDPRVKLCRHAINQGKG